MPVAEAAELQEQINEMVLFHVSVPKSDSDEKVDMFKTISGDMKTYAEGVENRYKLFVAEKIGDFVKYMK